MRLRTSTSLLHRAGALLRNQTGASLVLIALSMTAMLGIAGLVLDGGHAFAVRRQMQNAVDAASLAGARVLAVAFASDFTTQTDADVAAAVDKYLQLNGWVSATGSTKIAIYVDSDGNAAGTVGAGVAPSHATVRGVRVTAGIQFPTVFAGLLGQSTFAPVAVAEAHFGSLCQGTCIFPIGIISGTYEIGTIYDIFDTAGPGNFGWLDVPDEGSSTQVFIDYLQSLRLGTCTAQVNVGDDVHGNTGVSNASGVRNELDYWLGKTITILIWDYVQGQGNNFEYHAAGFANFTLGGYDIQGQHSRINGIFRGYANPGRGGDCGGLGNYGAQAVYVVR